MKGLIKLNELNSGSLAIETDDQIIDPQTPKTGTCFQDNLAGQISLGLSIIQIKGQIGPGSMVVNFADFNRECRRDQAPWMQYQIIDNPSFASVPGLRVKLETICLHHGFSQEPVFQNVPGNHCQRKFQSE